MTDGVIELADLTIAGAVRRLRDGTLTSRDLTEACLDRLARDNGRLNAFITVTADLARAQAAERDRERRGGRAHGPLHGIPISIKDLIDVAGLPTTAASRVRAGHVADRDAPLVARLRLAGAVFVGKTNLDEFGIGTTGDGSTFGPVRHPLDESRSPGGSSSGSAVSVLSGMCLASVGSDTGGSIRIPAAACGLVGLKPAWADLPNAGVVPVAPSLDCVGVIARTVADAAMVHAAIRADPARESDRGGAPDAHGSRDERPLRLGVPRAYFLERLQRGVRVRFDEAMARLRGGGHVMADLDIEEAHGAPAIFLATMLAEGAAEHEEMLTRMPEAYTPAVRARLELGRFILPDDRIAAQRRRECLRAATARALATCDALVLPTLPIFAPTLGEPLVRLEDGADAVAASMLARNTLPFNLTGHPAMTVPLPPIAEDGRTPRWPCGLQIVARSVADLVRIASACERVLAASV